MKRALTSIRRFSGYRRAAAARCGGAITSITPSLQTAGDSKNLWATHARKDFSTTPPLSIPEDVSNMTGEECYKRALDALEQAKIARQEEEAKRSKEQFEAWQKAQEAERKGRSRREGVAVIKTIAKQARQTSSPDQKWEKQAHFWMEKAALEHGHATALVRLGNAAMKEANAGKDEGKVRDSVNRAMDYYEMAGDKGSAEGWFNLGHLLWSENPNETGGSAVIEKDNKKSMRAFHKAIDLGDRDAMFFVGVQLLSDDEAGSSSAVVGYSSLEERYQAGLDLIERAASLEHGGALYYLSLLHLNGHDELQISPCSPEEFVKLLDSAANAGDPDALFLRGHSYYHGDDGYEQDFEAALENFLLAAEVGNSDAAVSAGAMLHQGVGVQRDQKRAFELYQMAGELGNVDGWRNVVACYALGEGVPQSEEMAKYIAKTVFKDEK